MRPELSLHWILRLGVAGCFIGHGAFGFIKKEAWLPYFAFAGIGSSAAWRLMPAVGAMDVLCGLLALFLPVRLVFLHLVLWGLWTAALRPLTGEPAAEFLERAGNYGVPLALLVLSGRGRGLRSWFEPVQVRALTVESAGRSAMLLRLTTAALLLGHGALGAFTQKALFARHYAAIGLEGTALFGLGIVRVVGFFELALGLAVLLKPLRPLLVFVLAWKLATEMLFPLSGAPWWEFIERAGSYAAPLALLILVQQRPATTTRSPR